MMRAVLISVLTGILMVSVAIAADEECWDRWDVDHHSHYRNHLYHWDSDIDLEIDNGDVIITCDRRRYKSDEVRITESYKLYVNGERVDVEDEHEELLKGYYRQAIDLHEEARIIGREGVKIGVEGAKIGTKAAAGALKMLFLDFDDDDFEREIEGQAEELEEMAEELEERAEALEEMAENLEDIHDDLSRKIPELRELRWF
jgi:hypothetical protein